MRTAMIQDPISDPIANPIADPLVVYAAGEGDSCQAQDGPDTSPGPDAGQSSGWFAPVGG